VKKKLKAAAATVMKALNIFALAFASEASKSPDASWRADKVRDYVDINAGNIVPDVRNAPPRGRARSRERVAGWGEVILELVGDQTVVWDAGAKRHATGNEGREAFSLEKLVAVNTILGSKTVISASKLSSGADAR
jgi:hypothetical protein